MAKTPKRGSTRKATAKRRTKAEPQRPPTPATIPPLTKADEERLRVAFRNLADAVRDNFCVGQKPPRSRSVDPFGEVTRKLADVCRILEPYRVTRPGVYARWEAPRELGPACDALPWLSYIEDNTVPPWVVADLELFAGQQADDWFGPVSPSDAAKMYKVSPRTFARMRNGASPKIRTKQLTTKQIKIHPADLPQKV